MYEKLTNLFLNNRNNVNHGIRYKQSEVSYPELITKAKLLANKIKEVQTTGLVTMVMGNSTEYVVAYLGILISGNAVMSINYYQFIRHIKTVCKMPGDLLITDKTNFEKIKAVLNSSGKYATIFIMDDTGVEVVNNAAFRQYPRSPVHADAALLLMTTGTTGTEKFVQISEDSILSNIEVISRCDFSQNLESEVIVLPMNSSFIQICSMLESIRLGCSIIIHDGDYRFESIARHFSPNSKQLLCITPSLLYMILSQIHREDTMGYFSENTILVLGGEECSAQKIHMFKQKTSARLIIGYGLTEASALVSCMNMNDINSHPSSVGRYSDNVQIRILPIENLTDYGEILLRGETIALKYYPEEIVTDDEGWLHTGDLGYIDKDGYLYVKGRIKRIIISSGRNISASLVESALQSIDGVARARVYAVQSDGAGERVAAKILVDKSSEISVSIVLRYLRSTLEPHEIPSQIIVCDSEEEYGYKF